MVNELKHGRQKNLPMFTTEINLVKKQCSLKSCYDICPGLCSYSCFPHKILYRKAKDNLLSSVDDIFFQKSFDNNFTSEDDLIYRARTHGYIGQFVTLFGFNHNPPFLPNKYLDYKHNITYLLWSNHFLKYICIIHKFFSIYRFAVITRSVRLAVFIFTMTHLSL